MCCRHQLPSKKCEFGPFKCLDSIAEPANKHTMMLQTVFIPYIQNKHYRSGHSSLILLEESYDTSFFSYVFPPFSPFFERFNGKIGDMISAGLFGYWLEMQVNPKGFKRIEEGDKPQVLTMEHFSICFEIWLISLAVGVSTFIIEMIFLCCKAIVRTWLSANIMRNYIIIRTNLPQNAIFLSFIKRHILRLR